MQPNPCRKSLRLIALVAGTLLAGNVLLEAQEAPKSASANPSQAEQQPVDARALSEALRELQSQVQSLKAELSEMKAQQKQTSEDARELRRQLYLAALSPSPGSSVPSSVAPSPSQ